MAGLESFGRRPHALESRTTIRGPDVVMDCMWQVPEARKAYETDQGVRGVQSMV